MKRAALVLAVAAITLLACGDDDEGGAADDTVSTTTTTSADAAACVDAVREAAPDEAAATFPDAVAEWTVLDVEEGGLGMQLAELEPSTDDVGYPSFRLVFGCGGDEPVLLAVYALDGEEYVLLSTTDAAEGTEFAPVLEE